MENARNKPTGSLKISQDVLATIARVAALEIEGVAGLAEPTGSMGRLVSRGFGRPPIRIEQNDDFAKIDIALDLKFGAKIAEVCTAVQTNVKENIQTMTGMAVAKVNVTVEGITFPQDAVQAAE